MDLFAEFHRDGNTIVMVTHNPEIQRYFDRTIVLRDGRLDAELTGLPAVDSRSETDHRLGPVRMAVRQRQPSPR